MPSCHWSRSGRRPRAFRRCHPGAPSPRSGCSAASGGPVDRRGPASQRPCRRSRRCSTTAEAWLTRAGDALATGRPIHVLGDGLRLGAVEQAALMLREAPRIEAFAWDTGDWLHVGLYTLFPGDAVLLFSGSPADDEAIRGGAREGGPRRPDRRRAKGMLICTWRSPSPSSSTRRSGRSSNLRSRSCSRPSSGRAPMRRPWARNRPRARGRTFGRSRRSPLTG